MLNKAVSRKIKDLTLHCPNKGEGCKWTGTIRDVESHLYRENGYGYMVTVVSCGQCKESFTRLTLANHQKQVFPYRPYSCDYCGHKDTLKVITEEHWAIVCVKNTLFSVLMNVKSNQLRERILILM